MKSKFKLVSLILLFSLLTASASVIGYTYAAYLNEGKYQNPLDINTSSFTSYFYGGNGTESTPYLLSTPAHLRNLQKLTKLGVFHSNTYFSLNGNINWGDDPTPLLPIGTEDTPFNSQFNGMGYTITGLVVDGSNTNDIGMFGYVGISGRLRNLVLNAPIIQINANTGGTRLATINPLENIFGDYARNTYGNLTRVSSTGSSVTFSTPNTSVISPSLNGGNPINIVYESSNTNLLYQSTTDTAQWITKSTSGVATEIFPVQLQARVYAQYDNKIISYTLERWQINVNGNGTVATDETGFYKTMYPVDGHHEVYVGFFAGHLDGGASYLGLWGGNASGTGNGFIYLNGRSARSYNVLIGRSRDDNDLDSTAANFYSRFVDVNTLLKDRPNYTFDPTPAFPNLDTTAKINTYNNTVAGHNQTYYGLTANEAAFIRLYPPLNHVINTGFKTTDHEGNIISSPLTYGNTVRYNTQFRAKTYRGTFNQRATVASSLWFWATKQYVSIFDSIFSEAQFQLQFRLTYFVNNTTSTANQFKVLINTFSSSAFLGILAVGTDYWDDAQTLGYYNSADYPLISSTNLVNVLQEKTITLNITQTSTGLWGNTPMIAIGVGKGARQTPAGSNSIYETNFAFDPYELNIVSFDVLVTSADGNISSLLNFVDILHTTPTRIQNGNEVTFSNWSKPSNTKIQFDGMNFNNVLTATTYRFWRTAGFGSTGINSTVNGRFTTGTPYTLTNTSGYSIATLESGA